MKLFELFEDSTRSTKKGGKGTLVRKVGRPVTCTKVHRLKKRKNATSHDKAQANWFINFHNC